jgi:Mg2+-importing ATPase
MAEQKEIPYWKLQKEDLFKELNCSEKGLDDTEATRRLRQYGPNEIPSAGHRTSLNILVAQFKNPLIYVLIFASALAAFLEDTTEAIIIVAIMLTNATLGFAQEHRSERAVNELKKYLLYTAITVRNGKKSAIDTAKLVPGDIVHLSIGDIVPADIRLLEVDDLQTDESVLTGESTPVEKTTASLDVDKPLPHQLSNAALMGSTVTDGLGIGLVVSTGKETYFGHVASGLSLLPPKTDFQKNIASFGNFLIKIILILTAFVFAANSILGRNVFDSLLFSLALAVGIIPEALPVVITLGLSEGALVLVKKKVIVKRLEAIEDLGNADVLCTDKTGTLTQNKIMIQNIVDSDDQPDPELMKYALLCNSAIVEGEKILGNPIDVAIWEHARQQGFDETSLNAYACVQEIPFGFNRRRMSIVVERAGRRLLISKGAPESILGVSKGEKTSPETKGNCYSLIKKYGQTGNRLIALAIKEIENKFQYSIADESNLIFTGLLVLSDPPKEDAAPAISRLKSLGLRLKILSGDDPIVTADVCNKLGIGTQGKVITGADLGNIQESDLTKIAEEYDVFGRVSPDQKYAIVNSLKKNGHATGFLGDGVNDAPALKLADAGISVDSAAQVAKEASSIILLEKSLAVIADGVTEGRRVFGNITKYIMNTISANFGNMFTLAIGSLFLPFIPLLPSQILLANLLSDAPLLTISTDNLDDENLRTPKKWKIGTIARFALYFGVISSIFDFVTITSLIYLLHAGPELFRTGWFIESVISEITVTFAIRTRRPFYKSRPSRLLTTASTTIIVAVLLLVYSPVGPIFEFTQPPLWFLALVFGIIACYFLLVETLKHLFFNRYET